MLHRALLPGLALLTALPAGAQGWNDGRTRDLVQRATSRRALQLADSTLVDYSASARGYLTFLAQLGEGRCEVENQYTRVVPYEGNVAALRVMSEV